MYYLTSTILICLGHNDDHWKNILFLYSQIVEAVIGFLRDPHPRVRYAACNAIGQMATDFAPVFQKKFHESVVPGLLLVMDDGVNPRVQVCQLLAWLWVFCM